MRHHRLQFFKLVRKRDKEGKGKKERVADVKKREES
jgi:hypothetical protein